MCSSRLLLGFPLHRKRLTCAYARAYFVRTPKHRAFGGDGNVENVVRVHASRVRKQHCKYVFDEWRKKKHSCVSIQTVCLPLLSCLLDCWMSGYGQNVWHATQRRQSIAIFHGSCSYTCRFSHFPTEIFLLNASVTSFHFWIFSLPEFRIEKWMMNIVVSIQITFDILRSMYGWQQ